MVWQNSKKARFFKNPKQLFKNACDLHLLHSIFNAYLRHQSLLPNRQSLLIVLKMVQAEQVLMHKGHRIWLRQDWGGLLKTVLQDKLPYLPWQVC